MNDEQFMQHMETAHASELRLTFDKEPDHPVRILREPYIWGTFHSTLHRLFPNKYDHGHEEVAVEQAEPCFEQRSENIWVNIDLHKGLILGAYLSEDAAEKHFPTQEYGGVETWEAKLHRPTLAPIYGGETLLEALWGEMDRLMEGLMTQTDAEDGGDKFRAQATAWVIAISTNPYAPSVDVVRAEAMRRWNAAEAEANAQEEALNPDQPEGADQ